jgi:hypothetical protein
VCGDIGMIMKVLMKEADKPVLIGNVGICRINLRKLEQTAS